MATLIPEMTITEFRKLKAPQLKRLKCCEVYSNGEYLFSFVNGMLEPSGYLRTQSENNCQLANAVGGETLEEVTKETVNAESVQ